MIGARPNPFAHASSARYAACHAPGCAACFYLRMLERPRAALLFERIRLDRAHARGAAGHAWPQSNYRRALKRAIEDSAPIGAGGRGSVTRASRKDGSS